MDEMTRNGRHAKRRSGVIHTLFRWTGRLYAAARRSIVGRALTAYRRLDNAVGGGRQGRFRVAARGRMPVADAVKQSRIIALVRGLFCMLYDLPTRFYGLFMLTYGALGSILHFLVPLLVSSFASSDAYLAVASVMMVLSLPPLTSRSSLRQSVTRSYLASLIFCRYFGLPDEPVQPTDEKLPWGASVSAVSLAFVAAIATLFTSPYLVLIIALWLITFGLVFSYPEAGVLITTAMLPAAWLFPSVITPIVGMILLTWISYGLKLLRLHRTVRYDLSDVAVLLLIVLCLISGVGGILWGEGQLMPAVVLFVCLSEYFLIVQLMTTRAYVSRCLFGVGLSAVVMTAVSLLVRTDATALDWMQGSLGGTPIVENFAALRSVATGVDHNTRLLLAVVLMPFLCACLLRARRLFTRVVAAAFLLLNLYLALTSGALGALACIACVLVLFFLLCDHRSLAVGGLLLPVSVGLAGWYFARRGPIAADTIDRLSFARYVEEIRSSALWQRVCQAPFGLGVGADCEGGSLMLQALVTLGWPGFVVSLIVLVLLIQKSLTALSLAVSFADRVCLAGLLCGVLGALLRGMSCGFLLHAPAMLMLVLFCAAGSAFANILFDEYDMQVAESMDAPTGSDRIYRRG